MNLFKRIVYYLIGVSFGSIIVYFIWKGKNVSFDYGMDARTLSSIRKKQIKYSSSTFTIMQQERIDSSYIHVVLKTGSVDFQKSNPRLKPCAEYFISGNHKKKQIDLYIKRCDSIATVKNIWVNN